MKGEFYKMDFRAWNVGTVDLTLEQEAAYLRLCHAMYDVSGPIPSSTRFLRSLFRCGDAKAAALVRQLIDTGKITLTDEGLLTNRRVENEIAGREQISSVRRAAGEKGGRGKRGASEDPHDNPSPGGGRTPTEGRVNPERTPTEGRVNPERTPTEGRVNPGKSLKKNDQAKAFASHLGSRGEEIRGEQSSYVCARGGHLNPDADLEAALRRASGLENDPSPGLMVLGPIHDLLADGYGLEKHILPVLRALRASGKTWRTWSYVLAPVREKNARTARGGSPAPALALPADPETYLAGLADQRWRTAIEHWRHTAGAWDLTRYTPPPDDPRTKVPQRFLDEYGIRQWTSPSDVRVIDRVGVAA